MMWLIYLYLVREVFTDLYALADEAYRWIFVEAPHPTLPVVFRLLYTLGLYAVVVMANGMILIGWALYNQYRFRGRDSRKAIAAISPAELGAFYGFAGHDVAHWQRARNLIMIHDAGGNLLSVVPVTPWVPAERRPGSSSSAA